METHTITVTGMSCQHCVNAVTEELTKLETVSDVVVDLDTGKVTFASSGPVASSAIQAAVEEAGYEVSR